VAIRRSDEFCRMIPMNLYVILRTNNIEQNVSLTQGGVFFLFAWVFVRDGDKYIRKLKEKLRLVATDGISISYSRIDTRKLIRGNLRGSA
jgi:hypothetical protein